MLVIGSRGSKLALWQANYTRARLEALGAECRIETISTAGDRFQSGPLKEIGNKGLFTKEIEEALLDNRIDIAVHSLKDMPAAMPEGLRIVATPEREDPRDAIIGVAFDDLKSGARIGTGSLRRVAQILAARPDLSPEPVRGNVDTRLRKLAEGQFDAIILAAAGLHRLGWADRIAGYLNPELMCPAVGQGALAIQVRDDHGEAARACAALDHAETHAAVSAERAVLSVLGGDCQVPVGAYAQIDHGRLTIQAVVVSPDGKTLVRRNGSGAAYAAETVGRALGEELLLGGAGDVLALVHGHGG